MEDTKPQAAVSIIECDMKVFTICVMYIQCNVTVYVYVTFLLR